MRLVLYRSDGGLRKKNKNDELGGALSPFGRGDISYLGLSSVVVESEELEKKCNEDGKQSSQTFGIFFSLNFFLLYSVRLIIDWTISN